MKNFKLFLSLLMLICFSVGTMWAEDTKPTVLFHETFGDNSGSARVWSDTYSEKSGVEAVYEGITAYEVSNAKQSKNTMGSDKSGLTQTTAGTDAYIIIGPLAVADYTSLGVTYQWKAASIKGTYTTKLEYKTSADGSYTEVSGTGAGATTFVERVYSLPEAAQVATLYLKITWNTSNTSAIIDEVEMTGIENACTNTVTVTKGAETNGTYSLSAASVCGDGEGGTVSISEISPADGYVFDEITATNGTVDNKNKKVTGITENTTISVSFKELEKYTVSFNTGANNPTQEDIAEDAAGEGITLPEGPTPACSADGWSFAGWAEEAVGEQTTTRPTLWDASDTYHPTDNVTLYAVYSKVEDGGSASVKITPSAFTGGKDPYTLTHDQEAYTITANSNGNNNKPNVVTTATGQDARVYADGTVIVACESPIYELVFYISTQGQKRLAPITASVGTIATQVSGDKTVTWTGEAKSVTLTIGSNSDYGSESGKAGQFDFDSIRATSRAATTYYLSAPTCCPGYAITISDAIEHGTVKAPKSACEKDVVTLIPQPDAHCQFVSWDVKGVDGEEITVTNNTFTMPAKAVTVSATFEEIKSAVTFAAPTGGMLVIRNEAGAEIVSGDEIKGGASLTITAAPDVAKHYIGGSIVVKDADDKDVTGEVLSSNVLTMPDYAISISASFIATYAINIVAEGGQVSLNYEQDGAKEGYAKEGARIKASAAADPGYNFKSIAVSVNAKDIDISAERAEFTMPAEAVTITAEFSEETDPTINVDNNSLDFGEVDYKGVLRPQTFEVSGSALAAGKLAIVCSNNAAFEVSPAEIDVDGTLKATPITVTPTTNACGTFEGKITISGGSADAKEVSVKLTVNKLQPGLEWSASEYTATIGATNTFPTLRNPRNLPVTYSSLYEDVAEIDAEGAITLKKVGETIIYINFAGNDTVEALAKDAIMYDLTVQKNCTAKWYINGGEVDAQTDMSGTALKAFPSNFSTFTDCSELQFVGWTTEAIVGKQAEAPATLITETAGLTMPENDINYYAVFADQKMGIVEGTVISFDGTGGSDALANVEGVTLKNIGSDYDVNTHSPYLVKLDGNSDHIQFALDYAPTSISIGYKMIGGNTTSKIKVQECATADGTFADVEELTISGATNSKGTLNTTKSFSQKYVRLLFVKGSNVGVGPISVVGKKNGLVPYNFVTTCPKCDKVVTFAKAGEESGCTFELQIGGVTKESVKSCEAVELDLVATIADGYELSNVALSGIEGASYAEGKITIPADVEGTLTVSATFSKLSFTVTLAQTGDAEADLVGGKNDAHYGETIEISASEVEGYGFINWTADPQVTFADASARATSFSMPNSNVTATANYAKILTIEEAIEKLDADKSASYPNTFVSGIICTVGPLESGAITYWISVDGLTEAFEIYKGKGLNGAAFTSADELHVGDKVIVLGTLKYYAAEQIYELATGSKLYKLEAGGSETGIENAEAEMNASKVMQNGQIYILRGGKTYTVQGQLVK